MIYDATERIKELHDYYDERLDRKIAEIAKLSGVDPAKLEKINPADFAEKTEFMHIQDYEYQDIAVWLKDHKRPDNYLISPLDDEKLTADQIGHKEHIGTERIRASKCQIYPIHGKLAMHFLRRNHRQSLPNITQASISFGLIYKGQLVGAMIYDKTAGGIRGKTHANYELLRLAFAHGKQIMGGASKLQKACESTMRALGEGQIFSYSNATINNGRVYEALGFHNDGITGGQPFVMCEKNQLIRLINLRPATSNKALARDHRIKTHLGGNITWTKDIK